MKTLIALTLITISQAAPAQKPVTPEAEFLNALAESNYTYIASRNDPQGMRISVFGEQTDPKAVCEMADKHPKVAVRLVKNPHTEVVAYCARP